MRIGELARQSKISIETIRYYEKELLLPEPDRDKNNYRRYQKHHLDRLLFIRNCRAFNMTQQEIRQLIKTAESPLDDCHTINEIIHTHIEHIGTRIQELEQLREKLINLQKTCVNTHTADKCTIFEGLNSMEINPQKLNKTHLS